MPIFDLLFVVDANNDIGADDSWVLVHPLLFLFPLISLKWLIFQAQDIHIQELNINFWGKSAIIEKGGEGTFWWLEQNSQSDDGKAKTLKWLK